MTYYFTVLQFPIPAQQTRIS